MTREEFVFEMDRQENGAKAFSQAFLGCQYHHSFLICAPFPGKNIRVLL